MLFVTTLVDPAGHKRVLIREGFDMPTVERLIKQGTGYDLLTDQKYRKFFYAPGEGTYQAPRRHGREITIEKVE